MDNVLNTYEDIVKFVNGLPGSAPPRGGLVSRTSNLNEIIDPRVEKEMASQEAQYIFDKYFVSKIDRKKLIAAILNIKIIG